MCYILVEVFQEKFSHNQKHKHNWFQITIFPSTKIIDDSSIFRHIVVDTLKSIIISLYCG